MDQKLNAVKLQILRCFKSQADFSQAVEMDESYISRVLNGRKKLKPDQAERWASVLNVKPKTLAAVIR